MDPYPTEQNAADPNPHICLKILYCTLHWNCARICWTMDWGIPTHFGWNKEWQTEHSNSGIPKNIIMIYIYRYIYLFNRFCVCQKTLKNRPLHCANYFCLSICIVSLSVCLSIYQPVCLSINQPVCLSIYPPVCLAMNLWMNVPETPGQNGEQGEKSVRSTVGTEGAEGALKNGKIKGCYLQKALRHFTDEAIDRHSLKFNLWSLGAGFLAIGTRILFR